MRSIKLELRNGHFDITSGSVLNAVDPRMPFLIYEENNTGAIVCRPDAGLAYDAQITVPEHIPENVVLSASGAALSVCPVETGVFTASLKNSSIELSSVISRRISLSLGNGNVFINAVPSISADIECGFGTVDLHLPKNERGYLYDIEHGAGTVTLNSQPMPRTARRGSPNGIMINIRCGMGAVNIYEY